MKELKPKNPVDPEQSLYEQVMNTKSKFSSREEAIAEITKTLENLAQKNGCSVSEFLEQAENSKEFNEDFLKGRHLRMTLSSLKNQ